MKSGFPCRRTIPAALLLLSGTLSGIALGGCTSAEDKKSAEPSQYQAPKESMEKAYGGAGAPAGGAAPAPAPPGPAVKP